MQLKDSGNRREFASGAVRDINEGKGRCDLLPLDVVATLIDSSVLKLINAFVRDGQLNHLYDAVMAFTGTSREELCTAMLEVAKHYEDGCNKYGDRNWEKGIPLHCYIDSGVRHYLKWFRGDKDEPHDRAFVWNMLGAIWTQKHLPELCDLPFKKKEEI